MEGSERRREPRFRSELTVELESGKGITRDFSCSGIFFETDRPFSPGQSIEFTLVLEHIDPERPYSLKCRGEIVRVEENGQKIGVAASIQWFAFEEFQQYMRL